jgi:hypothetical protein
MPASLKRLLDQADSPNNGVSSCIYACLFFQQAAQFSRARLHAALTSNFERDGLE